MKIIDKIGFFRLTLIPLGLLIMVSAFINYILGMGVVGLVILIFGLQNKCLLLGRCEVDSKDESHDSKPQNK